MRGAKIRVLAQFIAVVLWLPLAGCDTHDKAFEPSSDTAAANEAPPAAQAPPPGDVLVAVTSGGAITCRIDGAAIIPLNREEVLRYADDPKNPHLLIVQDNVHDREACFPVRLDVLSADFRSEGRATIHRVSRNLILEADGPVRVAIYTPDPRDDVDDCAQFASDGDIARLADRINVDRNLVDGREPRQGMTPLAKASAAGRAETVDFLLDRKAGTEIKDYHGYTALHHAVLRGRLDIVRRLVHNGADVNAVTAAGNTPMHLALDRGYTQVASFLASAGANGNLPNQAGKTPMQMALDKVFELSERRDYGPFADGSSIRYADSRLYVLRARETADNRWEQFDLPESRESWISLQGTNYMVMVRGRDTYRVWARYHPESTTTQR